MPNEPVPVSLIVDDGAPINLMYWEHPFEKHVHLIPNGFLRDFAAVCRRHGAAGKFSVLPNPSGLGWIDQSVNYVPAGHLRTFLDLCRKDIAPRFDITIELLTHDRAVDLATGKMLHVCEDAWASTATAEQLTDYIAFGLKVLQKVGLPPDGVTSPWALGCDNEPAYAEGVARAMRRVGRHRFGWYFLHCLGRKEPRAPWVAWRDEASGLTSVTVPANTDDPFWATQNATTARAAKAAAAEGADKMLAADGRTGRVRELFDAGIPITLLTHWQSLFSNGRAAGLAGLDELFRRINAVFGDTVAWIKCSDLARAALRA